MIRTKASTVLLCDSGGDHLNPIRGFAGQRQYGTLIQHSPRFPIGGALLVRQDNNFIEERDAVQAAIQGEGVILGRSALSRSLKKALSTD
jgi:hypothetical protein